MVAAVPLAEAAIRAENVGGNGDAAIWPSFVLQALD